MEQALALIFYIVCVITPVFFWLWFFRRRDQGEPEPKPILLRLFLWGGFSALLTIGLQFTVQYLVYGENVDNAAYDPFDRAMNFTLLTFLLMALFALIEEAVKLFIIRFAAYYSPHFTQVLDGVLYGVCIGLGFAFIENTGYFFRALAHDFNSLQLLVLALSRALMPLLMHITTAGIVGLYLGRMKFSPGHSRSFVIRGFLIATFIHVVFNLSLIAPGIKGFPIAVGIIVLGLAYLLRQLNKPDTKMIWKLTYK